MLIKKSILPCVYQAITKEKELFPKDHAVGLALKIKALKLSFSHSVLSVILCVDKGFHIT